MNGPDLGLSEAEFKALVRMLLTSLTYLPWILQLQMIIMLR